MTGRELILYILENNLEDEPVIKDDKIMGFLTSLEASAKFNVGIGTVDAWASLGYIDAVWFMDELLIPVNTKVKENNDA